MATRLYTGFMIPNTESIVEDKVQYWVDVQEDFQDVFNRVFPLHPPTSSLEARGNFTYTKVDDGKPFACTQQQICGIEEI